MRRAGFRARWRGAAVCVDHAQASDDLPHRDFGARGRGDLGEHADDGRLDGQDGLIRFDFQQRLAAFDLLAYLFEPAHDGDGRIHGRQVGHPHREFHRLSLSATTEQIDALEDGVANGQASGHEDILAAPHSEQPVRVGTIVPDGSANRGKISLFEISAEIHLGHTERDGIAERLRADACSAVQNEWDGNSSRICSSRARSSP